MKTGSVGYPGKPCSQFTANLGCEASADAESKIYSRKPGFTETRLRPFARRREITARPPLVFIRVRNPCVFERRRRLGWNVRLGIKLDLLPVELGNTI